MKKTSLFAFILCSIAFAHNIDAQNTKVTYSSTESRNFEPRQGVIVTPLMADLKVITQTSVSDSIIFPILVASIPQSNMSAWISEYKKQAMSLLLKKYKADAFIGPLTDVTTTADGRMMISISGFPAKYVNFRNATSEDVWIVSLYSVIDRNATETLNSVETKTVLIK
jgi:hypothetical protein